MTSDSILNRSKALSRSKVEKALDTIPADALPASSWPHSATEAVSVVVVLGMHRSGTSLLSNVLHYLGADMADETDHVSSKNPGGFWERPDLVALQDEVLAAIGRPVASPIHSVPFPAGWWRNKDVLAIKKRMLSHLEGKLGQARGWWGFKDPRTCRLLPLWNELFEELGIRPHYVWAIRSPGEAAASMAAKNPSVRPMSPEQAEITWLAYNYDVLRYTLGSLPVVVEYGEWFNDSAAVGRKLLQRLNLPGFSTESEMTECLARIVRTEYRNQIEGRGAANSSFPLAQTFFNELCELAKSEQPDYQRLGRYVALLDVTFRTLRPFVALLGEVPTLRLQARETEKAQERLQILSAEGDELGAKARSQQREISKLRAETEDLKSQLAASLAAGASERASYTETKTKLFSTRAEAERLKMELINAARDRERLAELRGEMEKLKAEHSAERERSTAARERMRPIEAAAQAERQRADRLAADAMAERDRADRLAKSSLAERERADRLEKRSVAEHERADRLEKTRLAEHERADRLEKKAQAEHERAERLEKKALAEGERADLLEKKALAEHERADRLEKKALADRERSDALDKKFAAEHERAGRFEQEALAKGELVGRLENEKQRLLQLQASRDAAAAERVVDLERKLAALQEAQGELRIANEGYIARIEALKGQGWLQVNPLRRPRKTRRFVGVPGLKGLLETADAKGILGWAYWPERPTEHVELAFYDGERFLGVATANRMRPDLARHGIGDGSFVFFLRLPPGLADGKPHLLDIRLAGTARSVLADPLVVTFGAPAAKD